ncbi:MAG: response regulator, partial [Dehalococcoidia bacterium]
MKAERILIVDDEPWAREMMQEILEREGYHAVAVGSGEDAVRQAEEESFDLLLADIVMPRIGGLELVKEFREISPETIPLLITGYASIETAQAAMRQGVYDYIVKPFDRSDLCAAVAKALRRKRVTDQDSRLKELVGLYKVSQSMVTSKEQREVLEFVLNTAVNQTKSSGGAVLLFDTSRQGLVIAAALGGWEPAARLANAMLEEGIDSWTAKMSGPTLFTNVEPHPLFALVRQLYLGQQLIAPGSKGIEMLLLPIGSENEIFGVLNVYREGEA